MGKFKLLIFIQLVSCLCFADRASDIEGLISKYHQKHSFHGNVLVEKDGKTLVHTSIGEAQAEWKVPHTADSKFMIASLSKSFTAALILILQNNGELSVEDAVADYISLPKNSEVSKEQWAQLKIKHLLTHTGGIIRDFNKASYLDRSGRNDLGYILFYALSEKNIFINAPGEKYYYSNLGYLMLAEIIESIGFVAYENQLKNKILNPLKMYDTGEFHRLKYIEYMSDGYFYGGDRRIRKRCCDDTTSLRGAASLYSTTSDLLIWLKTLENSVPIFGFDLKKEMLSFTVSGGDDGDFLYGYGIMEEQVKDNPESFRLHHNGHEWGYVSSMAIYPQEGLKIVVLANRHEFLGFSGFHAADALSQEIADYVIAPTD